MFKHKDVVKALFKADITGEQDDILVRLWQNSQSCLVQPSNQGKTFILSLHVLLKSIFEPGSTIVVTSSSFRKTKAFMDRVESFLARSPFNYSVKNNVDGKNLCVGSSQILGMPCTKPCKLQAQRPNGLVMETASTIPVEIRNEIISYLTLGSNIWYVLSEVPDKVNEEFSLAMNRRGIKLEYYTS